MMKILKEKNIPVGIQLQSVEDNFNNLINKTMASKAGIAGGAVDFLKVPMIKDPKAVWMKRIELR